MAPLWLKLAFGGLKSALEEFEGEVSSKFSGRDMVKSIGNDGDAVEAKEDREQ